MTSPSLSAGIVEASDRSLLVVLGEDMDLFVHRKVASLTRALLAARLPGVLNVHPAYTSVLIDFDPLKVSASALKSSLGSLSEAYANAAERPARLMEIPVCYDTECGPDLEACSHILDLSKEEIISLHSRDAYTVFFLGFAPGFPYMGVLPAQLTVPRLASPRTSVPPGSVAIAGNQAGIYPGGTPGGWRIIGRTPLSLFNPLREPFVLLGIGDAVKFVPITKDELQDIQGHLGET